MLPELVIIGLLVDLGLGLMDVGGLAFIGLLLGLFFTDEGLALHHTFELEAFCFVFFDPFEVIGELASFVNDPLFELVYKVLSGDFEVDEV